jgi:RND superfamily putative drug exporter
VLRGLGRTIARRPRWFAFTWTALIAAGFATATLGVTGESLFDRLSAGAPEVPSESLTGQDLLAATSDAGPTLTLLLDGVDPADPAVAAAVTRARDDLTGTLGVRSVTDPYAWPQGPADPRAAALLATDGRGLLVTVETEPGLPQPRADALRNQVTDRLEQVADGLPGATATVGGIGPLVDAITGQIGPDLARGEAIALPVSMLVMVVVFGGFLAAGLPLAGAVAAIAGGLSSLLAFSYLIDLDASVVNVVTVLGLGLCIDYGLLLVSRYREEVTRLSAATRRPERQALDDALEHTMATAGRTVLFSGVTVAISLSGLMFFDASILRAVGAAGVSVVIVAMVAALTFVPSLLALAGQRMVRPGITHWVPGLRRAARRLGDVPPAEGAFSRLARGVQRRPLVVVGAVLVVLVVAALPLLQMRLVSSGAALLPQSSTQRRFFDALDARFPAAAAAPVVVVARATGAPVTAWAATLADLPGVASVAPPRQQGDAASGVVSVVDVRVDGSVHSAVAKDVVHRLRSDRPDFPILVTGQTAALVDFVDAIAARAPLAGGLVVLATFLLLFLMTGSLLVPVKALLMNVVSLGASFGVLVWVFQDGHLEGMLGFTSAGGIETTIPALVLAFGFGLAMDYEVFLLSRIKEFRDAGEDNDAAVVHGLQRSGRIITSAALIVVIVFAGFVAGKLLVIKQTGVALAVAVAVDATLVRMLLVPATMTLLGEWNWWAPAPLRRLHARFGLRES